MRPSFARLSTKTSGNQGTYPIQILTIDHIMLLRWESVSTEINFNKNDILGCLREIHEWTEVKSTKKNLLTLMDKTVIRPDPYGVVLIIGSWNYPLHISLAPLAGAISAGNCAVIKPSEISPHTANAIAELLPRYLDPTCFQ